MFHFSHFELYFALHSCVLSTFPTAFAIYIYICIFFWKHNLTVKKMWYGGSMEWLKQGQKVSDVS